MSRTLFISDLHLDKARPEHLDALRQFLNGKAQGAEALYVLGDLFEAWIGDDDDDPFNQAAIAAFRQWSDANGALYFMHGNRDFLLGDVFAAQAGGRLMDEGTVVDLHGRPTLLMHGDSLCTADEPYQQFRAMVRTSEWQQDLLAKPLEERRAIAANMRMQSQQNNANKAGNIMDVTPEEVARVMQEAGVSELIHGHTHRPAVHDVDLGSTTGTRWVLGDWGDKVWYIEADARGNRLVNYPVGSAG